LSLTNTPAHTAKIFSTPEFHAAVLGLNPVVAVFDCDGTLWSGDAGTGFMRWTMGQGEGARGILSPQAIARIDQRYRGYLAGQVSELDICGEMVQIYAGLRESDMRAAAREFFRTQVERNIFPEMEVLLRELQFRGVEIWAVSSTCNWVIEEAVRRFHIQPNRVLAAQVEIDSDTGLVTDCLISVPTDEAKVAALARVGIPDPDAVFGNSIHDAAMLAIARANGAFAVNPSGDLLQRAAAEGWPVFYPASVRPAKPLSLSS
jgi:phosphoserine phosphatase